MSPPDPHPGVHSSPEGDPRPLVVRRLGVVAYDEALALQADLVAKRRSGEIPDTLLVLEHPHVITLGSSAEASDVLVDDAELARQGVDVFRVGRGGAATYHGPGQLVVYPILDLKPDRKDLHRYLRDLETVLIEVAAAFGVSARTRDGMTGVWTDAGKLAAIGVRVSSHWIASHGVALNVSCDLARFGAIVPCGMPGEPVTSFVAETGSRVDIGAVADAFEAAFVRVFRSAATLA